MHQPDLDPTRGWQRRTNHRLSAGKTEEGYNGVDCLEWRQWTYRRLVEKKQAHLVSYIYSCMYIAFFCSSRVIFMFFQMWSTLWKKSLREQSTSLGSQRSMNRDQGIQALPLQWCVQRIPTVSSYLSPCILTFAACFCISCYRFSHSVRPCFKDPEDFVVVRAGNSVRVKVCYEVSMKKDSDNLYNWVGEITFTFQIFFSYLIYQPCVDSLSFWNLDVCFRVEYLTFDLMRLIPPGRTSTWGHLAEGRWAYIPLDSGYQYRGNVAALHSFVKTFRFSHLHHQSQELCGRGFIWYWSQSYR